MEKFTSLEHEVLYDKLIGYYSENAENNVALDDLLASLHACKDLQTEWAIHWGKGPFQKIAALFKKTMRFFIRWYINPIAAQQSKINNTLLELIKAHQMEIQALRTSINLAEPQIHYNLSDEEIAKIKSYVDTTPLNVLKKRARIAFFTPLSPIRSGIATYCEDILLRLKEFFDIDIYIDKDYTPNNPKITSQFKIFVYTDFEKNSGLYDTSLFHMGNNVYHWYMVDIIRKHAGIVMIHDVNLTGLALFETQHDGRELIKIGECERDKKYLEHIKNYLNGSPFEEFNYPLNGYVINPASGIIVHSDYARKEVYNKNIGKIVKTILHYADPAPCIQNSESLRVKYGFKKDDILIASFGHIAPTKRPAEILKAFARLVKENTAGNLKYLLVGQLHDESLLELIEKLEIKDYVRVTGYTSEEEFSEYNAICDICVNLRYPYKGENSGTLARTLACGKPVIVTDIGSFSEIPDNACIKVSANTASEIDEIYSALKILAENPALREKYGAAAAEYVREYLDIDKIALEYRDFILEVIAGKKPAITEDTLAGIARDMLADSKNDVRAKAFSIAEILSAYM